MKKLAILLCLILAVCMTSFACETVDSSSEKQSSSVGESVAEPESETQKGEYLGTSIDDAKIIQALQSVRTDWFNLRGGAPSWFKNFLEQDLVTLEISEGIDCYYALFVLEDDLATDYSVSIEGCKSEASYYDGYSFFLNKRQSKPCRGQWVCYEKIDNIPLEIAIGESTYKLDLCMAKKVVKELRGALSGESIVKEASAYMRYPLKLDGDKLVAPESSELYESYGSDQEVYSLNGKFVTAKPSVATKHYFMGDLINDSYFLKLEEIDGEKWLNDRFYHEDLEFTKELYLSEQFFTSDQLLALDGVFAMVGEELKINFTLVKSFLIDENT